MSDTPIEVRRGRRATVRTDIPDWVTMSDSHPVARTIYLILAAHVNQKRGDKRAWPTMDTLAEMVGYSRGDKITKFVVMLEKLGAIDTELKGMPARNVYTVHETPPDDYAGPLTVADWYDLREVKRQLSAVPPVRGEQDETATPVNPVRGEQVNPVRGGHVAPTRGRKQPRSNNHELTTPKKASDEGAKAPSSSSPEPAPRIPTQPGRRREDDEDSSTTGSQKQSRAVALGVESVDQLVREVRRIRPGWFAKQTRPILEELLAGGEPMDLVALAAQYCAQDTDNKFPVVICMPGEHWDRAAAKLRPRDHSDQDTAAAEAEAKRKAAEDCPWRCEAGMREVIEPDRRTGIPKAHLTRCDHIPVLVEV